MKCWKCGQDLEFGSIKCSNCSASVNARSTPETEIGKAMRGIYDEYGCKFVFSDKNYLVNGLEKWDWEGEDTLLLRDRLALVMDAGTGTLYLNQLPKGQPDYEFSQNVRSAMIQTAGLNEAAAMELIGYLNEMIGWIRLDKSSLTDEYYAARKRKKRRMIAAAIAAILAALAAAVIFLLLPSLQDHSDTDDDGTTVQKTVSETKESEKQIPETDAITEPETTSTAEPETVTTTEPETTTVQEPEKYRILRRYDFSRCGSLYLRLLKMEKDFINKYNWQKGFSLYGALSDDELTRSVVFADVYGNSIPEMIYITGLNGYEDGKFNYPNNILGQPVLHIVTYEKGGLKKLYSGAWDKPQTESGAWYYYLFQTDGPDKTLYAFAETGGFEPAYWYFTFEPGEDGLLHENVLFEYFAPFNSENNQFDTVFYEGEDIITEAEYKEKEQLLQNSVNNIIMYSRHNGMFVQDFVNKNGCQAMTVEEAIDFLK